MTLGQTAMHQLFIPGGNLLLVHEVMVKEEMQRNDPRDHRHFPEGPRPHLVGGSRRIVARTLIAIGTRLDPGAPAIDRTSPAANA